MLPKIQEIVFEYLAAEREKEQREPSLVKGLHANASSAGACARQIAFRISGLAPSNPITSDALFNFSIGDAIHEIIQTAMLYRIPTAVDEVKGAIDVITCRADLLYPAEDHKLVCCEIKSVSDFAFKLATGAKLKSNGQWNKKDQVGEGPKPENILQVGISAKAIGADYVTIIYVRKTATKGEPICAEWRFAMSDIEDKVDAEISRLKAIVGQVEGSEMPDREYQGQIIDPKAKKYPCTYCSYADACIKLGPGVVKIA